MIVRQFTSADIGAVHAIEQESLAAAWSRSQIAAEGQTATGVQLVAEVKGVVCGYAFFRGCGPEAELMRIAVTRDRRGEGMGRQLLEAGLHSLAAGGTATCFLEVRASNLSAQQFYVCAGFVACGVRPGYYENPVEDAILMQKELIR